MSPPTPSGAESALQPDEMPRPLLPPRGIFIPASLAYDRSLPAAARETWVQLRGLAWGRQETPALSLTQITGLLGKKQSTLYGHMRLLRSRGALRWRTCGKTEIIFVFPQDDEMSFSRNLEKPDPPLTIDLTLNKIGSKDSTLQDSGKLERRRTTRASIPAAVIKPFVETLAEVTGMQAELNYPRLARCASRLHKAGHTAEKIASLYALRPSGPKTAWYKRDWRGQKGQHPTPEQIEQTIAVLSAPAPRSSNEELLRRLAEQEGIDFDDLKKRDP